MREYLLVAALFMAACTPAPPAPSDGGDAPEAVEEPLRLADPEVDLDASSAILRASVNPFENDLRGLEIAVRLKDEFRIRPQGVEFQFQVADYDGNRPLDETFSLAATTDVESELIASQVREGYYITTYRLAGEDEARMHEADLKLKALKAASTGGNELNLQAITHTCVEPDAAVPDTFSLTVYIRTHPDVDFVTLSEEWLMDRANAGALQAMFDPCEDGD